MWFNDDGDANPTSDNLEDSRLYISLLMSRSNLIGSLAFLACKFQKRKMELRIGRPTKVQFYHPSMFTKSLIHFMQYWKLRVVPLHNIFLRESHAVSQKLPKPPKNHYITLICLKQKNRSDSWLISSITFPLGIMK